MTAQVIDLLSVRDLLGARPIQERTAKPKGYRRPAAKAKPEGMPVLFVGGPLDGEMRSIRPMATRFEVHFRPPNAPHQTAVYEVAVETQNCGEFHFVGFEYPEGGEEQL